MLTDGQSKRLGQSFAIIFLFLYTVLQTYVPLPPLPEAVAGAITMIVVGYVEIYMAKKETK